MTGAPPGPVQSNSSASASKPNLGAILRFSWKLIKSCPGLVAIYVVLNILSQIAIPQAISVILGPIVNSLRGPVQPGGGGGGANASETLHGLFWLWIALTFGGVVLSIVCRGTAAALDGRMKIYIRSSLMDAILRESPDFYFANDAGRLNLILDRIGIEAQQALRSLIIDPILQVAGILSASVLIAMELRGIGSAGWVVMLVVIVVGGIPTWLVSRKTRTPVQKINFDLQHRRMELGTLVNGIVNSPEEIQTMGAEPVFAQKQVELLERLRSAEIKQALTMESVNASLQTPGKMALALVIFLALFHGNMISVKPGVFLVLYTLVPQVTDPFRTLASFGIQVSAAWPSIGTVLSILKPRPAPTNGEGEVAETLTRELESRDVRFSYRAGAAKVFDGLSFSAPSGAITGLVGKMGQGKTTFFRLLLRFYNPDSGEILVGGVPVSTLSAKSVREHVGMMSQFPAFFPDTIGENFRMAKPDASDAQIREVCEQTGIWPILERNFGADPLAQPFPAGQSTKLSGGQKKLFALTRCLLRDPKFLLLDEPTTGMDNIEKFILLPMMRKACAGKTVLVVDHDIPFITEFCDRVVVLDGGRVVQTGTPAELLEREGLFKELHGASARGATLHASAPGNAALTRPVPPV